MNSGYQICTRCIMDTSDPNIVFDEFGVCSNCHQYDIKVKQYGYKRGKSEKALKVLVDRIKSEGKNQEYDCILAVHVDAGWNTDIAVENIKKMCDKLKIDLHTIVIDWPTMKEIQRAYMFSGLPNLDVPQDHVFLAAMYQYAQKYKVKYMLNGSNLATEGILPSAWGYAAVDFRNIKSVYKKYGRKKTGLKKYPHFGILKYFYYQQIIKRINLLNYIPYSKKMAIETLEENFGWSYYGGKHFESRFTKFFQAYYLPQKFGYDKKRAHLSSLIVGGEMTREEALEEMKDMSGYSKENMMEDRDYILKKLDISLDEWKYIMKMPVKTEDEYANNKRILQVLTKMKKNLKKW